MTFKGAWGCSWKINIEWGVGRLPIKRVRLVLFFDLRGTLSLHGLHFDKKSPQEFIERVKEVINTQFRNENRAVFGKGPYRLR